MPTYRTLPSFQRDFEKLTPQQRKTFMVAVRRLVSELRAGTIRSGLRVKPLRTAPGVFEMSWAPDGRATFEYGEAVRVGQPHIIWRRIGGHEIFDRP